MLNLNENTLTAYKDKIKAQVKEMKAKMILLEAEAEKVSADARIDYQKSVNVLKTQFKDIEMRLNRFSSASEDSWEEIRKGIDRSMSELRTALANATKHFVN